MKGTNYVSAPDGGLEKSVNSSVTRTWRNTPGSCFSVRKRISSMRDRNIHNEVSVGIDSEMKSMLWTECETFKLINNWGEEEI